MKDIGMPIGGHSGSDDLFASLAEQIKLPFMQISHAAELLQLGTGNPKQSADSIMQVAGSALSLIEGYLLNVDLQRQGKLELEPVSTSSVMYDVLNSVSAFAKLHNCKLELDVAGRYGPVMADRRALMAALTSLGHSFILASSETAEKPSVSFAVKKNSFGVGVGVYSNNEMTKPLLDQARRLRGRVRQPFGGFDSSTGVGIFVADELFARLDSEIRASKFRGLSGLAATLQSSKQLSLV